MNSETRNAIAHIIINIVGPGTLPVLRLTTLLYLSDWRSAIKLKRQITDIAWVQPFVAKMPEIVQFLEQDKSDFTLLSGPQPEVMFTGNPLSGILSVEARTCVDFVLRSETNKSWPELFRLAYSTYPMFSQPAQSSLDLVLLSELYERMQHARVAG
jgi:endonuclease/exonuclease/phosphatase (EEP) superfamily protein YafD